MLDKEKLESFYEIHFDEYGVLGVKRKNDTSKYFKHFGYNLNKPLYLTFNEVIEGNTDKEKASYADKLAEAGKILKVTAAELYEAYTGKTKEELMIEYLGYDLKTKKYLDACYNNMGYTGEDIGYNVYKYELLGKYSLYLNAGDVEIGKMDDGRYIATYSMQTDIDDYVVCNYFFNKYPSKQDIENIKVIEDIYSHLKKYGDYKFKCWECGNIVHWLDAVMDDKSLKARYENLKEHYDGC